MQKEQTKSYLHSKNKKFQHYPLKEEIIELLKDENYRKPTLVQAESMPITLQDNLKNLCVIVYAYNGAGKTLTYLIPILNSLSNVPHLGMRPGAKNKEQQVCRPQALIIVPTEALLDQVYEYLNNYADFYLFHYKWSIVIGRVYGGKAVEKGHILVCMPAKLENVFKGTGFDNSELKWIVFDECDKVKEDALDKFTHLLEMISSKEESISANLLITSATGNKDNFRGFIQQHLTSHNILELDSKEQNLGLQGVTHFYSKNHQKKDQIILNLLGKLAKVEDKPQVIIFFNQIGELRKFYNTLRSEKNLFVVNDPQASEKGKNNLMIDYIHGKCGNHLTVGHLCPHDCETSKADRVKKLKNLGIQVLLGTDAIGRGIDIRTVALVINYSQARTCKQLSPVTYIHRVGRTGRYSDEGIGLTFVNDTMFIQLTQQQMKIKFIEMTSEEDIIARTLECSGKNKTNTVERHHYES